MVDKLQSAFNTIKNNKTNTIVGDDIWHRVAVMYTPENALASWEDMQNQMTEKLKTLDSYISVLGEFIEKYVDSK